MLFNASWEVLDADTFIKPGVLIVSWSLLHYDDLPLSALESPPAVTALVHFCSPHCPVTVLWWLHHDVCPCCPYSFSRTKAHTELLKEKLSPLLSFPGKKQAVAQPDTRMLIFFFDKASFVLFSSFLILKPKIQVDSHISCHMYTLHTYVRQLAHLPP